MKRLMGLCLMLAMAASAFGQSSAKDPFKDEKPLKVPKKMLVVTVTKGFRHSSIPTAEKVLGELAEKSGWFTVDYVRNDADMASKMTMENLAKYDGVIFANTTGDLPLPDKEGFLKWLASGKAFVGMHSATDTFRGHTPLDPYVEMIGGEFKTHGAQVEVEIINQDKQHAACKNYPERFRVKDEIYILNGFERKKVHGLLTLEQHPNSGAPGDYPIAWCKTVGHGKIFYTSLGHREDVWESIPYQLHVLGGIKWALGLAKGSSAPQGVEYKPATKEYLQGFRALFNGENLDGWKLRDPGGRQSWSAQNGMLVNDGAEKNPGTDLVSDAKFQDFVLRYDYMVPKGGNSGVYLRGRYEIQVLDDLEKGKPTSGGNGAIYGVAPVSKFVSRKPGEWQQAEVTLKGDRATVVLNGEKVHDKVLLTKTTGGGLDENVTEPGPIMLQGNHNAVAFRNVRIKPLK